MSLQVSVAAWNCGDHVGAGSFERDPFHSLWLA